MDDTKLEKCTSCKSAIPKGAIICKECNRHQSLILENIKYVSGIIGILTASIAFLTFVFSNWHIAKSSFLKRYDISVLSFSPFDGAVVKNSGREPVYLSHISTKTNPIKSSLTYSLNHLLKPGEIAVVVDKDPFYDEVRDFHYLWGVSDTVLKKFDSVESYSRRGIPVKEWCHWISFLSSDHPVVKRIDEYSENTFTKLSATGELMFYPLNEEQLISEKIELVAVYMHRKSAECEFLVAP